MRILAVTLMLVANVAIAGGAVTVRDEREFAGTDNRGRPVTGTITSKRTVSCAKLKAEWDRHQQLLDNMETAGERYREWHARNAYLEQLYVQQCE